MSSRLVQFTDLHLYADPTTRKRGVCTRESFEAVVAAARGGDWPPDAILVTGDIAEDESAGAYLAFREVLDEPGAPVLCLPGNHDDPVLMQALLNDAPFRYLGAHVVGEWLVVLLDSRVPGEVGGALGQRQLDALDLVLCRHRRRHALISLHHPPVAMQSAWLDTIGLAEPANLFSVLDRHDNVRGVLWGHAHQELDAQRGSLRLLCTPSTGRQFAPRQDTFAADDRPPGYRRLILNDDGSIETAVAWLDAPTAAQTQR